jgi:hypothetical protein
LKQQVADLENEKAELLQRKGAGAVGGVINTGKSAGMRSSITGKDSPKKTN